MIEKAEDVIAWARSMIASCQDGIKRAKEVHERQLAETQARIQRFEAIIAKKQAEIAARPKPAPPPAPAPAKSAPPKPAAKPAKGKGKKDPEIKGLESLTDAEVDAKLKGVFK